MPWAVAAAALGAASTHGAMPSAVDERSRRGLPDAERAVPRTNCANCGAPFDGHWRCSYCTSIVPREPNA